MKKIVCAIAVGLIVTTLTACDKPKKGPVQVTKTVPATATIPPQVVPQPRPPKV